MLTVPLSGTARLLRMFGGFVAMPLKDKALLLVAWCLLGFAAALLLFTPFRRLAPLLGKSLGAVAYVPTTNAQQAVRAQLVRTGILRAARIAPFRADCLPQAFAAALMCRMLGVPASVHLGVRLDEVTSDMSAHAWVSAGPVAVSGGRSFDTYTAVACFIAPSFPG